MRQPLPFAGGSVDLILSNVGVNNFDDPAGSLRECRRVAKDGGVVALTTNVRGHMQEFYEIFDRVLVELRADAARQMLGEHINRCATVAGVRQLLEAARLSVGRVV